MLTLVLGIASVSVFAQGTIVFNNLGGKAVRWDENATPVGKTPGALVTASDGILVQLLWLRDGTAPPEPVGNPVSSWPLAGTFNGGQREVPLANTSDPGWVWQIRAWSEAYGTDWQTSYEASPIKQISNGQVGGVVQFNSRTGDPQASISPQGMAGAIPAFTVAISEPSVTALTLLGLGALFLVRRRR